MKIRVRQLRELIREALCESRSANQKFDEFFDNLRDDEISKTVRWVSLSELMTLNPKAAKSWLKAAIRFNLFDCLSHNYPDWEHEKFFTVMDVKGPCDQVTCDEIPEDGAAKIMIYADGSWSNLSNPPPLEPMSSDEKKNFDKELKKVKLTRN